MLGVKYNTFKFILLFKRSAFEDYRGYLMWVGLRMKFKKVEVIQTDDEGFLVLKGILPEGSIIWHRSMGDKVIVMLVPNMGIDYIIDKLMSLHRTLSI